MAAPILKRVTFTLLKHIKQIKLHQSGISYRTMATEVHEMIKPASWLLGKWRGTGKGYYPTIDDFTYEEEVEFSYFGKPMFQYSGYSWNPETKAPLHREVGFLRIKPNTNHVALMLAHNLGSCDMEEGEFNGQELTLLTRSIANMSFDEHGVQKVKRTFKRNGDKLEQVVSMETVNTPMTEHLKITYEKSE